MDDEVLDLVTRNDEVIGTINRMDYPQLLLRNNAYIRSCDLFIVNSKNEVYVPVRTANKTIAPNGYDFSVGGHVSAGEDYIDAIIREAYEEVNLHLPRNQMLFIAKTIQEEIRYIQSLFMYRTDLTPTFNPNDFVNAEWMTIGEFTERLNSGHPAKGSLKHSLQLLKGYLANH